ncbi:MAG: hypothetical protein ACJ8IR_05965 [Alphaproteobacteria bacterium]|jgi:hypothetical protein
MPSRMDYVDAAFDALGTVMPLEQPIRIVLREVLVVLCFGWLNDRDPTKADLRHLQKALEQAVAAA